MATGYLKFKKETLAEALELIAVESDCDGAVAAILDAIPKRDVARRIRELNRRATRCQVQLQLLLDAEGEK